MKNLSFMLSILGIVTLSLFLILPINVKYLHSPNNLEKIPDNTKLYVSGNVIEEKINSNSKTLILDNDLKLFCDKTCPSFLNKNISALVIKLSIYSSPQLKILSIK